jgi:transcriptional regulator with XRE-family HTH domain
MKDFNKEIGSRLKEVRKIYNGGFKATIEQFAAILGETKYNLSNYENGKANLPVRVLKVLYEIGINPLYIINGVGSKFADNEAGRILREKIEQNKENEKDLTKMSSEELLHQAEILTVAAGNIMKIISERNKNE